MATAEPLLRPDVTVMGGDGAGPASLAEVLSVLGQLAVPVSIQHGDAGQHVFDACELAGFTRASLDSARRTRVVLKGPLATRSGTDERGQSHVLHALLDTYAHLCPIRVLPGVKALRPSLDVLVMHETSEGIQPAMEARHTPSVVHVGLQVSRQGTERFARTAMTACRVTDRQSPLCVTGFSRPMMADRMFREGVDEAARAAGVAIQHASVEEAAAQLCTSERAPDALLAPAWNGGWLTPLAASLAGGAAGLPSVHVGPEVAVFEPLAGADAPAGATCVAMMLSASLMLRHLGQSDAAHTLEQAVVCALEDDAALWAAPAKAVGSAVAAHLGRRSERWKALPARAWQFPVAPARTDAPPPARKAVGVDLWLESNMRPDELAPSLEGIVRGSAFKLKALNHRGQRAFPGDNPVHQPHDLWCCRFALREAGNGVLNSQVLELLVRVASAHRWTHLTKLQDVGGETGFGRPYTLEG